MRITKPGPEHSITRQLRSRSSVRARLRRPLSEGILNANPYEPPRSATEHTSLGIRFVGTSTLLATIAIAATFTDVPRTIENYFRNGTIQNVSSLLMTLLLLLSAVFCCWAEYFGTIHLQRFVTFVLTPVALFTIVVVHNFLNDDFTASRLSTSLTIQPQS